MFETLVNIISQLHPIVLSLESFSCHYIWLSFLVSLWYPIIQLYFLPKKKFKKSSWKLKAIIPKVCNHWTPNTTSTPSIGMKIIGLFNTYSPMDILILWHFLEKFMVPPFATITWHSDVGYRKQFNSLAILQWIKLWVLPELINIITFFFLIYPSILRVWGVVIHVNALQDIVRFIYSFSRIGS